MSEMIERVAFQIALEITEVHGEQERGWKWPDDFPGDTIDRARSRARGVISAMREPTEAMIRAAFTAPDAHMASDPKDLQRIEWRAMIDAALAEIPKIEQGR